MTSEIPSRSFSAGDLVMSCDPWVWALESRDEYNRHCAFCFAERQDLRTCSKCKLHRYCDAKCQVADWKQEHKLECTLLGGVDTVTNVVQCRNGQHGLMAVILMSKIAVKLQKNILYNLDGLGTKTAREIVDSLPCYPVNARRGSFFDFKMLEKINPEQLFPAFNPFRSQQGFVNFVRLMEYNAFPILYSDDQTSAIGAALIPQAPFRALTPVCWDSNVVLDFRGRKFVIHALEDIAPHTSLAEILIACMGCRVNNRPLRYTELLVMGDDPCYFLPTERRRLFQEIYNRPCDCRKCSTAYVAEINPLKCLTPGCTERIPSDERALTPCPQCGAVIHPDRLQQVARFVNKLDKIQTRSRLGEIDQKLEYALETTLREEIDTLGILHADAHIRFLVGWHGVERYQREGRFAEAWELSKAVISCVRKVIPRYHIRRAYFLMEAGHCLGHFIQKLRVMERAPVTRHEARHLLTELLANSMPWFDVCKEAWEIYRKLCGEDSQPTRDARNSHAMIEAEKHEMMKLVHSKV